MSEDTKWLYEEAEIAYNSGDYNKAYGALLKLLEMDPSHGPAHELLIKTCRKAKNPDAELRAAQDLYAKDPTIDNAKKLAFTYKHLQRGNSARKFFKQILDDRPHDCDALAALGLVCTDLEDYDEAIAALEKSVLIRPGDSDVLFALGCCYNHTGRLQEALGVFERMMLNYGGQEGLRAWLGRTLEKLGRKQEAYVQYVGEVKLHPSYPDGVKFLAEYYGSQGDMNSKEEVYVEGIEAAKKNTGDLINMGTMLIRQGRLEQGKETLNYAIENALPGGYSSSLLYNNLGVAFLDNDDRRAMEFFEESLKIFKSHHNPLHNMGLALYGAGRFREAEKYLLRALELEPDWHITLSVLGSVYFNMERADEGCEMYLRAIERKPKKARYRAELAFYLYKCGRCADAGQYAKEALKLQPDNFNALCTMALCSMDDMNPEAARSCLDRMRKEDKHSYNYLTLKRRIELMEAAIRDNEALDLKRYLNGDVPETDYVLDGKMFENRGQQALYRLYEILKGELKRSISCSVYYREHRGRFSTEIEVDRLKMYYLTGMEARDLYVVVKFNATKEAEAKNAAKTTHRKMSEAARRWKEHPDANY